MPIQITSSSLAKAGAVFVFLCGGVWEGFGKRDWTESAKLFGLAAATAGFAATGAKLRDEVTGIKADTEEIRDNPLLPGTPLTERDHFDRTV